MSPGDRYLSIVAPVNEVVSMFNAATDDTLKGRTIQALSMVLRSAISEIEDVDWPREAQGPAQQVVLASNAASDAASSLVSELTDESAAAFASEVAALSDASSTMRQALGLPSS